MKWAGNARLLRLIGMAVGRWCVSASTRVHLHVIAMKILLCRHCDRAIWAVAML